MTGYYQYYAMGMADADLQVRWSEPYIDGLGLGPMVSAVVPVYERGAGTPIFRGVVAIDMRSCDMYEKYEAVDIMKDLMERNLRCPAWSIDEAAVEKLRDITPGSKTCAAATGSEHITQCRLTPVLQNTCPAARKGGVDGGAASLSSTAAVAAVVLLGF